MYNLNRNKRLAIRKRNSAASSGSFLRTNTQVNQSVGQLYELEQKALREELHNLKKCQITFLAASITATGLLLGLGNSLAPEPYKGVAYSFPLILLLPFWWVFFDKATTITRVVGYYRILESLILGNCIAKNYLGWENSLRLFREMQKEKKLTPPDDRENAGFLEWVKEMIFLKTGYRYWIIVYYIFFFLSGSCIGISLFLIDNYYLIKSILIVPFVYSSIWNARIVWLLIHKKSSFNWNENYWRQILKIEES